MANRNDAVTSAVRRHDPDARGFASDNCAGVHPEVLAALALANGGHQVSYGADAYTHNLGSIFQHHFGGQALAYPVFNGTGANVVGLQAMTQRWGAVITPQSSHLHADECGAPEKVAGIKLLTVDCPDGKLTPELIDTQAWGFEDEHRAQPQVVSIAQVTELGTCYTPDEVAAICAHAHSLGMWVHMDGSRIANAAAWLGVPLRAFTTDAGVDVLSFGGTKNGLLMGEVVVVLNPDVVGAVDYIRKYSMQLASKMRFISVQCEALLAGDLWLRNAQHSNAMAQRLFTAIRNFPQLRVLYPVESNAVFVSLPATVLTALQRSFHFYTWPGRPNIARWMTSFDTAPHDVDVFTDAVARELALASNR